MYNLKHNGYLLFSYKSSNDSTIATSRVSIVIDVDPTKDLLKLTNFCEVFDRPCSSILSTNCSPVDSNLDF